MLVHETAPFESRVEHSKQLTQSEFNGTWHIAWQSRSMGGSMSLDMYPVRLSRYNQSDKTKNKALERVGEGL